MIDKLVNCMWGIGPCLEEHAGRGKVEVVLITHFKFIQSPNKQRNIALNCKREYFCHQLSHHHVLSVNQQQLFLQVFVGASISWWWGPEICAWGLYFCYDVVLVPAIPFVMKNCLRFSQVRVKTILSATFRKVNVSINTSLENKFDIKWMYYLPWLKLNRKMIPFCIPIKLKPRDSLALNNLTKICLNLPSLFSKNNCVLTK